MLRPTLSQRKIKEQLEVPDMNVTCLNVQSQENDIVGRKLSESMIRTRFHVNVVAIIRDSSLISNLTPSETIEIGDLLYVIGTPEDVSNFNETVSF